MTQRLLFNLVLLIALSAGARAQPVTLLGLDLEPQRVTLRAITKDGVQVLERSGNTKTLSIDEVLRLTFSGAGKPAPQPDAVVAQLADGHVLVGKLTGPGQSDESVQMTLASSGQAIELALDDLLSLTLKAQANIAASEDDDVVLLATGEKLVGFVETLSDTTLGFTVGDADDPIEIPVDRINALSIANKPKPAAADEGQTLARVLLNDGSTYLLAGIRTQAGQNGSAAHLSGRSTLASSSGDVKLSFDRIHRIEPVSSRYALVSLSQAGFELAEGGKVFGVPMPPRVAGDGSIMLHAPTTLRFDLPQRAGRLILTASLNLDPSVSADRQALAGCELVVREGGGVIGGCVLRHDRPGQRLNLPLKGGVIELELKPGVNGPVLDRVRLSDAELLTTRG